MREKISKLAVAVLGFLLVIGTPVLACSADITDVENVNKVKAGETTYIQAKVKMTAGHWERCDFLVETGVRPSNWLYRLFSITTKSSEPICCPGNENYAGKRFTVDNGLRWASKTKERTVNFYVKAPEPGMVDSCPPEGKEPKKYWVGEGGYEVIAGAYNGCSGEVADFKSYDVEFGSIYVESEGPGPTPPTPPEIPWIPIMIIIGGAATAVAGLYFHFRGEG